MVYPNGVVFSLKKRMIKSPISQTKANLLDILKAIAPSDCSSMQADIKRFYKKFQSSRNLKEKRYSENAKDWYTKSFAFPQSPKEEVKFDGEPAAKKQKTDSSPSNLSCQQCFVLK